MFSATTRTTKMKIAVPKTAPMTLFHSKESIAGKLPKGAGPARETNEKTGYPRQNTGGHYPPPPSRHCGEASHKSQVVTGLSAKPGLKRRGNKEPAWRSIWPRDR